MKFVIALMKHETNTFSPVPTPMERFGDRGAFFGPDARKAFAGTNTPMAAYLDLAEEVGAEAVTPAAGEAWPSGPVHGQAYETISQAILEAVEQGCDAVFLDLHGAMVAETTDDGEGTLVKRIRQIAPDTPIAVTLDLHANLTADLVDNATVITGYKTYPHTDMYEVGRLSGSILLRALKGEINPVMVWGNRPMLPHTLKMSHESAPMKDLIDAAKQAEARGALAASVFGGFPLADFHDAGLGVVVVTDGDQNLAEATKDKLLNMAWDRRTDFVYYSEPLAESIARANKMDQGPILLIDHADNCASGGTQDCMAVVKEVMNQGLEDVAVGAITDPEAVARMIEAGVGAEITIPLGGKVDMPSIGRQGEPLEVTGVVKTISDGQFVVTGPMYTGLTMYMGRSVLLDTGKVQIVVIERHHEPFDLGLFRSLGVEPTSKRYLLLKSRLHYRAGFLPIAKQIIECAGTGVTSSDYSLFKFQKIRRPIYPLDADM